MSSNASQDPGSPDAVQSLQRQTPSKDEVDRCCNTPALPCYTWRPIATTTGLVQYRPPGPYSPGSLHGPLSLVWEPYARPISWTAPPELTSNLLQESHPEDPFGNYLLMPRFSSCTGTSRWLTYAAARCISPSPRGSLFVHAFPSSPLLPGDLRTLVSHQAQLSSRLSDASLTPQYESWSMTHTGDYSRMLLST